MLLPALLAGASPHALAAKDAPACDRAQPECALSLMRVHPVKTLAFWKDALAHPLAERVVIESPELVDFLTLDTIAQAIPTRPRPASPSPGLVADVRSAIAEMPAEVQRLLERKLLGIRFVEDLGGTGFTDWVYDERGRPGGAFIVLDPSVLARRKANEWATWKERSPFRDDGADRLDATIETGARDDRMHAIQYILLHEFGHVLSVGEHFHPSWSIPPSQVGPTGAFPFFELSWKVSSEGRYVSRFDGQFPERSRVVYYFGPKPDGREMAATYGHLERTNFPTLYAATHPGDDFAESFANYVHTVRMGRPFEIRLLHEGRAVKVYGPCWSEERCEAKRAILEKMLQGP
jgi:hypothetical protein